MLAKLRFAAVALLVAIAASPAHAQTQSLKVGYLPVTDGNAIMIGTE